jgi:hypothetical protein
MEWNVITMPWPATGLQRRYINATVDGTGLDGIRPALVAFWARTFAALSDGPATLPPEWDTLFIEMWLDGGRLIAYPGRKNRDRRFELVSVQLTLLDVEDAIRAASPYDEPAFLAAHGRVDDLVRRALQEALREPEVIAAARALHAAHAFDIQVLEYDDVETTVTMSVGD